MVCIVSAVPSAVENVEEAGLVREQVPLMLIRGERPMAIVLYAVHKESTMLIVPLLKNCYLLFSLSSRAYIIVDPCVVMVRALKKPPPRVVMDETVSVPEVILIPLPTCTILLNSK